MTTDIMRLYKGNSSDIIVVHCDNINGYNMVMDNSWICTLQVKSTDETRVYVDKNLTLATNGLSFTGFITPEESDTLAAGRYYVYVELSNEVLDYKKDVFLILDVLNL